MKTNTNTTFNITSISATSDYNTEIFKHAEIFGVLDCDEFGCYRNYNLDNNSELLYFYIETLYPYSIEGIGFNSGEIFPVQAYVGMPTYRQLAKEGGLIVTPSLDPPPISGYASEIKVLPETPTSTRTSVKMSPSLIAKIKKMMVLKGTNCSQFIISSIEYYLQNLDKLIPIELKDNDALNTFTHIAFQLNCLTKELNILNKYSRDLSTLELEEKRQVIISLIKNGLEFISTENKKLLDCKGRKFNGK